MPRAIAPLVTTTTSTPSRCSAATSSQMRATTDSAQLAVVLGDDRRSQLDDGDRHAAAGSLRRVELEHHAAELDVVAGFEAPRLERRDHAHPLQPVLDVRQRLLVLEVVARDQAVDRVAGDAELAVARASRPRTRAPAAGPEDLEGSATSSSPAASPAGSASGTRRSSSRPQRRRARAPVAAEVTRTGHAEALAPSSARGGLRRPPRARGRPWRARGCAAARPAAGRARPARARSRAWLATGSEPSSGARSSTWTSSRVRSTWARKSWPEPGALVGALDQARDVGDHELAVVAVERAEHRLERRERVGGDLRRARASGARAATTCRRWAGRRARRRPAA